MKLRLVARMPGKWQGKIIPIPHSPFLIGRDPTCHLRPASALVSHRHCALLVRDGQAFVRDLGSTNGTFVNDQPVTGEREIRDADWLRVGPLDFDIRLEPTPTINQPTPLPPTKGTKPPLGDDHVEALLMAVQEFLGPPPGNQDVDQDGIPTGRTATDLTHAAETQAVDGSKYATRAAAAPMATRRLRQPVEWEDVGQAVEVHLTDQRILDDRKIQMIGEQLSYLVQEGGRRKLLLNLKNVQAMSSAMVDQLLAFSKKVQALNGQLVLCNIHPAVYPVFQKMKLTRQLTVRKDEQDGLQALQ